MDTVAEVCQLDKNGSETLKFIHLLVGFYFIFSMYIDVLSFQRFAGVHFDQGEGFEFMRLESDGPPKTSSPHILAIEPSRSESEHFVKIFPARF